MTVRSKCRYLTCLEIFITQIAAGLFHQIICGSRQSNEL